ncbi:MAG: hypothetical protein JWO42_166 [Chloroflexi bacterium]|nr:hypothetical protein [Chloroflexota bacterium]
MSTPVDQALDSNSDATESTPSQTTDTTSESTPTQAVSDAVEPTPSLETPATVESTALATYDAALAALSLASSDAANSTPAAVVTDDTEPAPSPASPRVRRFAPKRSNSAPLLARVEAEAATPAVSETVVSAGPVAEMAAPAVAEPEAVAPAEAAPPAPRPSRSRARRQPAPAANNQANTGPTSAEPGSELERSNTAELAGEAQIAPAMEASAPSDAPVEPSAQAPELTQAQSPARRSRRRGARSAAATQNDSEIPTSKAAEPTSTATAAEGEVEAQVADSPAAPGEITRTTRSQRSRRRPSRTVKQDQAPLVAEPSLEPVDSVSNADAPIIEGEQVRRDPYDSWRVEEDLASDAPGGELDGAEALARALLEMFPPSDEQAAPAASALDDALGPVSDSDEIDDTDEGDDSSDLADADLRTDGDLNSIAESNRRRGRRGRRGGRGRRRGAAVLQPADSATELQAEETTAAAEEAPFVASTQAAAPVPTPEPAPTSQANNLFVPESPAREDRSWRDRGPQHRWGRTIPRDTQPVTMPPPKPSNGARFAPIPQALPPLPVQPRVPEVASHASSPFVMPDLRTGEPLGPGETRTERLLEVQTRLMQAMLEGQARQLETLTASVTSLHQAVRDIATRTGTQILQPRTGIFVDAPNVCYAADNARVTLDFGRMLKYLSRDRQLVHALSYSPIIDDVREGIRYETQRFVAPFLRAGYKLITKPLKRFSDGSAKGNFDIELALDLITMSERLDVIVLVSGDSDFECVIEHIQSKGVRVEVVAFASNVSTELVNVADTFIDISQHLEHMRQL